MQVKPAQYCSLIATLKTAVFKIVEGNNYKFKKKNATGVIVLAFVACAFIATGAHLS